MAEEEADRPDSARSPGGSAMQPVRYERVCVAAGLGGARTVEDGVRGEVE